MEMNIKKVGLIIILLAIILLPILVSFSLKIAEVSMSQCVHAAGPPCSITGHIPIEFYVGVASIIVLIGFGVFLIFKVQKHEKFTNETLKKIEEAEKSLEGDESKVYQIIINGGEAVYQSEIMGKCGFSKVKVTRILDKLEGKGLIERRRRGMTNILLVKVPNKLL